jgi:hypothetical protein
MMTMRRRPPRRGGAVGVASGAEGREWGDPMAIDQDMVCGAVRICVCLRRRVLVWNGMRGPTLMSVNQDRTLKLRDF